MIRNNIRSPCGPQEKNSTRKKGSSINKKNSEEKRDNSRRAGSKYLQSKETLIPSRELLKKAPHKPKTKKG